MNRGLVSEINLVAVNVDGIAVAIVAVPSDYLMTFFSHSTSVPELGSSHCAQRAGTLESWKRRVQYRDFLTTRTSRAGTTMENSGTS